VAWINSVCVPGTRTDCVQVRACLQSSGTNQRRDVLLAAAAAAADDDDDSCNGSVIKRMKMIEYDVHFELKIVLEATVLVFFL